MRIVIDMQGAQTESRFRGIGRYSLALAKSMVCNRGNHETIIALSGLFPETIEPIRAAFDGQLPQENIRVWHAPGPVRECEPGNEWRREVAERIRESFLASLHADMIIVTSLFEGLIDDAVTSVGVLDGDTPVATILYDLIPLVSPDIHYKSSKLYQDFYPRKIVSLRRSRKLLAISDSTRREAVEVLGFDERDVINISAACDASFRVLSISEAEKRKICRETGIVRPFVMYVGGADERKNLCRLIQAYAKLPASIKNTHQLVFVGKMPEGEVAKLRQTAKSAGISEGQLLFTGYVSNEELARLYNLCAVLVLPSLHEGFGLPALEAMSCGAPVIGANTTSLPEVIGREDALFDPRSVESISQKITDALTDELFRKDLIFHGAEQAKKFSWDESAKRALRSLELFNSEKLPSQNGGAIVVKTGLFQKSRKKILIVKLDHMGDFILAIPAITKLRAKYPHAQIDIVLGSWNEPIAKCLNMFTNIYKFDFFKKKSALMPAYSDEELESVLGQLDSYDIAIDLRRQGNMRSLLAKTTARLKVGYASNDPQIDRALDITVPAETDEPFKTTRLNKTSISIQMLKIIEALPAESEDFILLPELQERSSRNKREIAIFPKAGNSVREWDKENFEDLVDLLCADERIDAVNVYFANREESSELELKAHKKLFIHTCLEFKELARSLGRNAVCVANNSFGAHLASYLGLRVIAVYAGQETVAEWAPVFGDSYVVYRPVPCSPCHIATKDDCKHGFKCLSGILPNYVFDLIMETPKDSKKDMTLIHGRMTSVSMAHVCDRGNVVDDLLESIAVLKAPNISDKDLREIAACIEQSIPPRNMTKQLFIDISELVRFDAKSGIQRVVRSILRALLDNPPEKYSVIPVYASLDKLGYFHAAQFTGAFLGKAEVSALKDEPISFYAGDIFLGLDLQPQIVPAQKAFFGRLRRAGVNVKFIVYDLLCVTMPHCFVEGTEEGFRHWLEVVAESDEAICISKTVADELTGWIRENGSRRSRPLRISWFNLGADLINSMPTRGLPEDAEKIMTQISARPSFLMVGTVEPRKGYLQTLEAFTQLWRGGFDINLIIVGKEGWKGLPEDRRHTISGTVDYLRNHPELNKHLFWMEGISDEYLEKIYAASSCLIAASEGEGFGLPLIEAAQHKLPIIARDIPVFREVAGEHAFYFRGDKPAILAETLRNWLDLFSVGQHPRSDDMPWLTWRQSAQQLLEKIIPEAAITADNHLNKADHE